MLSKTNHEMIMGQILRDIYSDISIAPLLGFKGGTCAYFFYGLPRFSVDLDFDLFFLEAGNKKIVADKIKEIVGHYGTITDFAVKEKTILFELLYTKNERRLKIEISTFSTIPDLKNHYILKEYFGIPMLIAEKELMFSTKLVALTNRRKFTMRDVYDIWFFGHNHWPFSPEIIGNQTGESLKKYLSNCIAHIEKIPDSQLLTGIGELLKDKQKTWIKNNLKKETITFLKIRQSSLK